MSAISSSAQRDTRRIGWIALIAAVLTVGLITYGAWVRASGSGLGCPDWPLCEGDILPTLEGDTAIEFGHRFYAGITALFVAAGAVLAYRARAIDGTLTQLMVAALGLIIVQAVLGGITVLTELHGMVRLAHLGMAMVILALVTGGAIRGLGISVAVPAPRATAVRALLLAAVVIMMGASIVGSHVSGGCPGLPLCDGESETLATWLHGVHRVLAALMVLAFIWVAVQLRRQGASPLVKGLHHTAITLVMVQGVLGVLTVAQDLPEALRILHLGVATLIWWALSAQLALSTLARER